MTVARLSPDLQQSTADAAPSCFAPSAAYVHSIDWDDLGRRLLLYANHRTSRYGKLSAIYRANAQDYVQQAVALFLDGTRHFISTPQCSLFHFLCGVIDSLASHDVESARRRGWIVPIVTRARDEATKDCADANQLPSPHDLERGIAAADELQAFVDWLEPDLSAYVRLQIQGHQTAAEYAQALNVTESEIRNMDRRLKRRRMEWRAKFS